MVDRCLCHDVTFAELRALAQRASVGLRGLSALTGCGTGCGLCRPYILLMLKTGHVAFPVLTAQDILRLEREADQLEPTPAPFTPAPARPATGPA